MKFDIDFLSPQKWMNAAGTAGYIPSKNFQHQFPEIQLFITNPISYLPRTPANQRSLFPYQGGFLIHSGYPNPGIQKIMQNYGQVWEKSQLPICVNLLSDDPRYIEKIIRLVENINNISAIEIGVDVSSTRDEISGMINAALGELPIILSLPYELVFQEWLDLLLIPEIVAISIQAPRGVLVRNQQVIRGRMYGESVFPLTMHAVQHLSTLQKPIFAGVGVTKKEYLCDLFSCGAHNFQAHELIWRDFL